MKYYLTITVAWLTALSHVHGQQSQNNYYILTVTEQFVSNGNVRTHHLISQDSSINSVSQFDYLYFDQILDYTFKKRCQNGDTLKLWDTLIIWSMSVVDGYKELDKIINDTNKLIGSVSTDKAKFSFYLTSVQGQFCRCFTRSDKGKVYSMYLPVNSFSFDETKAQSFNLNDFDLLWATWTERWSN